jgi:hypothetical protein
MFLPFFALIGIFIIFVTVLSQSIYAQLNPLELEISHGIMPNSSELIPLQILKLENVSLVSANQTEIEEAVERTLVSRPVFIENDNFSNPVVDTIVPNGTLLNVDKVSNRNNLSFFKCADCFVIYNTTATPFASSANFSGLNNSLNTLQPFLSAASLPSNETSLTNDTDFYDIVLKKIQLDNHVLSDSGIIKSLVAEPAIAKKDDLLLFLSNHYMLRSTDNGDNWSLVDMHNDSLIDICCDNRILYDDKHEIFVWYAQGEEKNNVNTARIAISKDGISWLMYYFKPSDIGNYLPARWFDFPHLVVGDKYLYLFTSVIHKYPSGLVMRISLDDLAHCNPSHLTNTSDLSNCSASYDYYYSLWKPNFAPIYNIDETLYWIHHISNNNTRIYQWDENSNFTTIKYKDVEIDPWKPLEKNKSKCDPDSQTFEQNWCIRSDSRVLAGWKVGDQIGFFWNADFNSTSKTGQNINFPYINGATFEVGPDKVEYKGRPYIYNNGTVFLYPAVSVNSNNEVGMLAFYGEAILKPSFIFGTTKNISTNLPWDTEIIKQSDRIPLVHYRSNDTNRTNVLSWGDYVTLNSEGTRWYGTAFVLEGGEGEDFIQPYYFLVEKRE